MTRRSFIGSSLLAVGSLFGIAKLGGEEKAKSSPPQDAVAPDVARVYWKSDMVLAEERCYSFSFQDDVDAENYWLEYSIDDGESASYRLFEQTEPSAEMYHELLQRVAKRAAQHGFSVWGVLSNHDPLSGLSANYSFSTGNYYQNLGAARSALARKENEG